MLDTVQQYYMVQSLDKLFRFPMPTTGYPKLFTASLPSIPVIVEQSGIWLFIKVFYYWPLSPRGGPIQRFNYFFWYYPEQAGKFFSTSGNLSFRFSKEKLNKARCSENIKSHWTSEMNKSSLSIQAKVKINVGPLVLPWELGSFLQVFYYQTR